MSSSQPEWQRLGIVPGATLRLFGMRRSGNHAISSWLQRNAINGNAVFLNNCTRKRDPLTSFASVEVNTTRVSTNAARADMATTGAKAGDGALFLFSYEDHLPDEADEEKPVSGPFNIALIDRNVLIYRSFLNWIASLTRKLQLNQTYTVARRAGVLMRAVDTYRRLLEFIEGNRGPKDVAICYDRWTAEEQHRAELLVQLGLPQRDTSLGVVQAYGGGSSFQKTANDASELETDQRWKQMAEDREYQALLTLSAQDRALTNVLERMFPKDREILGRIAANSMFPREVLT
ncbi:hypothetical protein [Shimia sediminis]|uniref:hypothetical protein n=1 Tax=Shimia sediminis TaxID=2497945 RepID=UPI001F1A6D48|nr:hypothetical protein [Shimia sediminis]